MVLVVLVGGQLPRANRGVERMRVGDEVRVSQIGRHVVCGGQGRRVRGRVALRRLGGHNHPADPGGVLQHLRRENKDSVSGIKTHSGISQFTVQLEMLQTGSSKWQQDL